MVDDNSRHERPDLRPPERGLGDEAHLAGRALLGQVPFAGPLAAEFFARVLAPPLDRRRQEWMESVAAAVNQLHDRIDGLSVDRLAENESFTTALLHASQAAVRTHDQEKRSALRNAVLNAALPSAPDDELQIIFLNYVDELTPTHLRILRVLDDPEAFLATNCIRYAPCMLQDPWIVRG